MIQAVQATGTLAFSASYIAALVILGVGLTFYVIGGRRQKRIGIGDAGDKDMARRVRVHGNFSETAPILMILLLALPLVGAPEWLIHLVGVLGLTGRILHAIGLSASAGTSFGRLAGMLMTITAMIVGAIGLLIFAWT